MIVLYIPYSYKKRVTSIWGCDFHIFYFDTIIQSTSPYTKKNKIKKMKECPNEETKYLSNRYKPKAYVDSIEEPNQHPPPPQTKKKRIIIIIIITTTF